MWQIQAMLSTILGFSVSCHVSFCISGNEDWHFLMLAHLKLSLFVLLLATFLLTNPHLKTTGLIGETYIKHDFYYTLENRNSFLKRRSGIWEFWILFKMLNKCIHMESWIYSLAANNWYVHTLNASPCLQSKWLSISICITRLHVFCSTLRHSFSQNSPLFFSVLVFHMCIYAKDFVQPNCFNIHYFKASHFGMSQNISN